MKKYYLLLPLIFTACMDSVEPVALDKKFKAYDKIQMGCLNFAQDESENMTKVKQECGNFITSLELANTSLQVMREHKDDAKYYRSKNEYKKAKERLQKQYKYLNLQLKSLALDSIEKDDIKTFEKVIGFPSHPLTISYYRYMQKNLESFADNEKMHAFKGSYSEKKYLTGHKLINRGKYTQGLSDLNTASEMGHVKASNLCGDVYVDLYPSKAYSCYSRAIEGGDEKSMFKLASLYEQEKNYEKAFKWYLASAKKGNFISQYKLYDFYANAKGILQDHRLGLQWLQKSAHQGYANAEYAYGKHLANKNRQSDALKYLKASSDKGYYPAHYALGRLQFKAKRYKSAYASLKKGEVNAQSMYMLAYLNEYGKGTGKNYYSALDYYYKAKKLGKRGVDKDIRRVKLAKKRLRNKQIKQQRYHAKVDMQQVKLNRLKKQEAQREDERLHSQWEKRKADAIRLKAEACGEEPTASNLRTQGSKIHLEGKLSHWLGRDAFIVLANGVEYYVKDEEDEARLNKGDKVNIVVISTGKREITHGLRRSLFDNPDEASIQKAYALDFSEFCPY